MELSGRGIATALGPCRSPSRRRRGGSGSADRGSAHERDPAPSDPGHLGGGSGLAPSAPLP